jgi:hypothetical protein
MMVLPYRLRPKSFQATKPAVVAELLLQDVVEVVERGGRADLLGARCGR